VLTALLIQDTTDNTSVGHCTFKLNRMASVCMWCSNVRRKTECGAFLLPLERTWRRSSRYGNV
jgi:hypothetical protein